MESDNAKEQCVRWVLLAGTSASILIVVLIFLFLGREAVPFLFDPGVDELVGKRWVPVSFQKESFGLLPLITGTLLVTITSMMITVPVGLCAAVYIAELARPWERQLLKPLMDVLAAVPSVVLGFFGLVVLGPLLKHLLGLTTGMSALTASLLLSLMAIPTVVAISEDAIRGVPKSLRQASLALGASSFQTTWRVAVPAASPGIVAAITLGIGRVIGETMAVMMVTGNAPSLTLSPLDSVRTMTATIALEMGEVALGSDHYRALFCVGVLLLIVTFGLNLVAQRALRKQFHVP
jgi:phosphate transport system permease protein